MSNMRIKIAEHMVMSKRGPAHRVTHGGTASI